MRKKGISNAETVIKLYENRIFHVHAIYEYARELNKTKTKSL